MITRLTVHLTEDGSEVSWEALREFLKAINEVADELGIDVEGGYFDHLGDLSA